MEKQLFKWDGWDEADTMTFIYYNVETIVDLPGIPVGSKFSSATVCYEQGVVELYDDNDTITHKFYLNLAVVPAPILPFVENREDQAKQIEWMDLHVWDANRGAFDKLLEESWSHRQHMIADNVMAMDERKLYDMYREMRKLRYNMDTVDMDAMGEAVDADMRAIACDESE